ncbi:MAG TPA: ATP-grasp domain-containing protein [Roseiarcus sp.]|nr:ATP-grasp domain-containing protein [Roseiarcus sp.]
MKILLTEGSGLTSRQVATRLGELGHQVEILSSTPICLTRFTKHVRRVHAAPRFGSQPLAWMEAAAKICRDNAIDMLFPTQEQAAVVSALQTALPVSTVVPDFDSLMAVQDKISACKTLAEVGVPQPRTIVLEGEKDIAKIERYPVFLKQPVSTASSGVRRTQSAAELREAARAWGLGRQPLLAQEAAAGRLAMIQALADEGRLIAFHANARIREGAGGGASVKESLPLPVMAAHVERLVRTLRWRGPISFDAILTDSGPLVIDVNPRLVEPMNAWRSGVDLVGAMLDLAFARPAPAQPPGESGVRTHQLLIAILGAAQTGRPRLDVIREILAAAQRRGDYANSVEELTPLRGDPLAALPVLAAALLTLAWPAASKVFERGAVGAYALRAGGWAEIVAAAKAANCQP